MTVSRRAFIKTSMVLSSLCAYSAPNLPFAFAQEKNILATGANGLYVQPWLQNSFLDLSDEFYKAKNQGQQLALLFEQRSCSQCKELHKLNFTNPAIVSYIKKYFRLVQIDIRGSRDVTGFDGRQLSERDFSQDWQINFTPTIGFFPIDKSRIIGQTARAAEAFRLTGYWTPFHFETVLQFVHNGS